MRIFLVLIVAFSAWGCAHDTGYGALQTSWDQATPSSGDTSKAPPPSATAPAPTATAAAATTTPAAAAAAATAASDAKKLTAADIAQNAKSGKECVKLAREYFGKDAHAAESLLAACVKRDDAIDLDDVISGPWINDMRASEPLQLLVAQ